MGGFDPLRDWQRKYYDWLRESGKEVELIDYPNTFHAFYFFSELPETSLFVYDVKEFMAKQMANVN
ncbi:Putative carboxylesterase 18 [Glycine soja]|nr:Putative carboxylesterase 18 [Glycine soja]